MPIANFVKNRNHRLIWLKNGWISDVLWTKGEVRTVLNLLKHTYLCVHLHLCECGGQSTTLGSCLFPHYLGIELRPSGLAASTTLPAESFWWPQFLFFYFQTWSTMWTWWHIPQSQPLERQRQEDGFESKDLSQVWVVTARLSWNKKSRPQISGLFAWNPIVHCPNVVFVLHYLQSLLLWSSQANASQCAWTFAVRWFFFFSKKCFMISSVLSLSSGTFFQ